MQAEVIAPKEYTFKEGRGQVICCLLAAHKMCQLPLDLDLTDGKHHHLLGLRGNRCLCIKDVHQNRYILWANRRFMQVKRST